MSKKLRAIIDAKHLDATRFYKDSNNELIERTDAGEESPTGIYQNEAGTYFTKKAWRKKLKRREKIRVEEERVAKKADVRTVPLAELENDLSYTRKRNRGKFVYFIGAILLLLGICIIGYFLYSGNKTLNVVEASEAVEVIVEPKIFGDAIITGDDVRMRAGPTLQDTILTYFANAGERVLIVQAKTDSLPWAKVQRKDATVGWVFGKYVEHIVD
jgi:hypothetical protein